MRILFLTLLDFSTINEKGIYTDLMREFIKHGHEVYIISPTEKSKKEPTKLISDNNVKILKLQIGNIQKTNLLEKGISTVTLELKFKLGIKKYFSNVKFDLILYSTPPITILSAVEFVKKRDDARTYLLLKDIFPQNAVDLGMLKTSGPGRIIYEFFRKKEARLYRISDFIGCMSNANVEFILKNNSLIPRDIVDVCPNSVELKNVKTTEVQKKEVRKKYKLPSDKFLFIYGGNLGKPQGIPFLIECIKKNEMNNNSFFVIVGSGTEYKVLKAFFEKEKPQNAKLYSQIERNDYDILVDACSAGLIFLDKRFTIPNFPSRILSYMQSSLPVLAACDVNTDLGKTIEEGEFGYWCESSNANEFNNLVIRLCDENLRSRLGSNSRKYLENNYTTKHSYEIIKRQVSFD